jgi:hypothetical protein
VENVCHEINGWRTFGVVFRKGEAEFEDGISIIA